VAVAAALALPASAEACGVTGLMFDRAVGETTGTLSWRPPPGPAPLAYRVFRDGQEVGETPATSIAVPVRPGRSYVFVVRVEDSPGAAEQCAAKLRKDVPFYGPAKPPGFAITDVRRKNARLVWTRGAPGDGRIVSYRVFRNGRPYKRVHGLALRVAAGDGKDASYQVAAADNRGHVSSRTSPLRVLKGHRPPGRPGRLRSKRFGDSEIRLAWARAGRGSGRIAGYRIYRDRTLVRQVRGLAGSDRNLAPATSYRYAVTAIDTSGYMSPPAGQVSISTAHPAPTQGHAHAFLLASTDESFRDLQRHYRQIGTVYPTYFDCRSADGTISGQDNALITRWAQIRRIKVLPRFNCQAPDPVHRVLTDPAVRAATLTGLVELVRREGYDGINLDFENGYPADRDAFTAFVTELAARLHGIEKQLTVEVSAKFDPAATGRSELYDYEALGAVADHVFVMNWGWHWATSDPGAPDDIELCRKVADYVASMPNKSRFVLGTHLYGMDWANGGGPGNPATALEHADVEALQARYHVDPVLDPSADSWTFSYTDEAGVHHDVWYADANTVARRVRLARERGLGIGFWRLGREEQAIWSDPVLAPGSSWP
jgi:spore germination protein YaaH